MRKFFSLLFSFALIGGLTLAQNTAQELAPPSSGPAIIAGTGGTATWAPGAVLFDNGPLVNDPGGGSGGADRSFIESALGHTLFGWGHQVLNDNAMADQFTIPAGEEWQIDELITFAYQTNAPTTSTIDEVRAQIWDGDPMAGGTVIWGNHTANIMTATTWSNIYRTTDTDPTNTARAIMQQTSTIGTTLTEGTYWVHWQSGGTLSSGPWCPPVTELGVAITGDALQSLAGVFGPALNGTEPNGAPFILMGSVVGGGLFFDDFEAYTAGLQLACQNPVDWDTWTATPCGDDDATISTNFALSGLNSALIDAVTPRWVDLIKHLGDLTSGKQNIVFYIYIPAGKAGYFNTLSAFNPALPAPPDTYWAMEVYLNAGGLGELNTEDAVVTPFTWVEDTWQKVEVVADLDLDVGEFWFNGAMVHTWQWTNGASTGLGPLQLAANDFFAPTGTADDEMYIDNYTFGDWPVPVELTSFVANVNNLGEVVLNWTTASELNNFGFEVERSSETTEFRTIGFVGGNGTTTATQQYSYVDRTTSSGTYFYRLKQVDLNGTYEYFDAIEVDVTGPLTFDLGQNYPNPFNPSTNIQYSVPASGDVRLAVYNLLGEEVAVLVDGFSEAGFYEVTFDASSLPSGAYFYKLQSGNSVVAKKMLLMK